MNKQIQPDSPQFRGNSLFWLEKSPVCTKILDPDFNLLYMSSAGVEALILDDAAAYYDKPYPLDFYPELFRNSMVECLEKAIETNEVVTHEGAVTNREGSELWFHSTIVPVENEEAVLEYIMVISIEITGHKQVEEELRKSQALFSQAEQMGKLGHWEWDVEADRLVSYSAEYANIFDMTIEQAEETISTFKAEVDEYVHEDDQARYVRVTDSAYENKQGWDIEFQIITRTKRVVYVHEKGEPIFDEQGNVVRTFGTLQDITERKRIEQQLSYQASHDMLTGLVNRREFEKRIERLLSTVKKKNTTHALCYMDLDQFKVVNDTCGHAAGDELLNQLGSILSSIVRQRDTLARLGGDEFGLLMEHCSVDDANRAVESILSSINDFQFIWEGNIFRVSASIGLVLMTENTRNVTSLLQDADAACYVAKDKGRNRIHIHHPDDAEIARRHGEMQWVTRLSQALEEDRFCLFAQTIVPLDGPASVHYELLLRLVDEKEGVILPSAFLPAAERYSLITRLDCWVIDHAFKALVMHPAFVDEAHLIAINLSGPSLADATFLEFVIKRLNESGLDATKICFEITETAAIANLNKAITFISELRKLGCRFALDDFGSGFSSFAYLKTLPVDYLKIDGMFVRDIVDDPIDYAMVKSINEVGQLMGMQTIAEFVESDEIKSMLEAIGVNYAQGHAIGKPEPFEELLRHWSK